MQNLFVVDGAAGTGKSDLLEYIEAKYQTGHLATVVKKYSTRPQRPEEKHSPADLLLITAPEFDELARDQRFYHYRYGEYRYGFHLDDIDAALREFRNVFIIVRDMTTIGRLRECYFSIRTIPVFIYSDAEEIRRRLHKENYTKRGIAFRLTRQKSAWQDYLSHSDIYEEVLLNNSNKADFRRLIDNLFRRYTRERDNELVISRLERFPLVRPLIGFKNKIQAHLRNYQKNVFVMMKYRSDNEDTYELVAEVIKSKGLIPVRAKDPGWDITSDTYNPVAVLYCCKYGVALFDEPEEGNAYNPNVAYELGMMHLQMKDCLILRHTALPDVPFDLIAKLHKPYTKDSQLRRLISEWIDEVTAKN
jgi:guanylate kinase